MLRFLALSWLAVLMLAGTGAAADPGGMQLPPQPKVHPAGIPANYVLVSPCIPTMGEHWANLKNPIRGGTIYGTYQGKPVFTEIMLTQKDFTAGKNFDDVLKPLPGYAIDHVDIDFLPHGHPGMRFAHYDIHAYYVPHSVHMKFCPGKMPM
jgi:hypothetical protein